LHTIVSFLQGLISPVLGCLRGGQFSGSSILIRLRICNSVFSLACSPFRCTAGELKLTSRIDRVQADFRGIPR
jgi:hypothetical protein